MCLFGVDVCGRGVEASFLDDEFICGWLTGKCSIYSKDV
jgi:hypothetical protein